MRSKVIVTTTAQLRKVLKMKVDRKYKNEVYTELLKRKHKLR